MVERMEYLLGLDIGTTATKCVLLSEDGSFIDLAEKNYELSYPREGWVEQNPHDWWDAAVETVRCVVSRNVLHGRVAALSLSAQGGALVLLDKRFKPVYNAVSWLDSRAKETAELLTERITPGELYRTGGWPIVSGLNFPTIFWFREKRQDIFQKARFFASTVDYMNRRLTGRFSIDHSNLALTMFLDLTRRDWSEKALGIVELGRDRFAEVVPSGKIVGRLTAEAAAVFGLSEDVLVVSGAHDQYCANIGAGAVKVGDCILSAGTAWVLLATCDRLYFKEESLSGQGITRAVFPGLHPLEGKYGLMTSVPFGGNSLKWFGDAMRPNTGYDRLNREASEVEPGCGGLIFIPILSSRSGKGAFLGLDGMHEISHFTRAVFEGVVFVNRIHLDLIRSTGVKVSKLVMIGGGTKSNLWPQIVADITSTTVELPDMKEAACTGAAILAGMGSGIFRSIEEAIGNVIKKRSQVNPLYENTGLYEELYMKFLDRIGSV
jgi:xylulokinase